MLGFGIYSEKPDATRGTYEIWYSLETRQRNSCEAVGFGTQTADFSSSWAVHWLPPRGRRSPPTDQLVYKHVPYCKCHQTCRKLENWEPQIVRWFFIGDFDLRLIHPSDSGNETTYGPILLGPNQLTCKKASGCCACSKMLPGRPQTWPGGTLEMKISKPHGLTVRRRM